MTSLMNLNDLQFFAHVVEQGGFTAASRRLGVPKSTLSKRLGELEAALGVRLLHRSSRSLALTDVGRDFYRHARAALIEAEAALAVVHQRLAEPSGTVRLTCSVPVAQFYLAGLVPALALRHPKLRLELHVTDRFVDLAQEGFDIAVRSHFGPLPDSSLVQRRIAVEPIWLLAAPAYLRAAGRPEAPEDLAAHEALLTTPSALTWTLWPQDEGAAVPVSPRPRLVADESVVLMQAAAAGLGIACLPAGMCRAELDAGRLERVLPDWSAGRVITTLLMPERRSQLPGVRAVVEFLAERLAEPD